MNILLSESLSHFSHHSHRSHQHPGSQDHNRLSFNSPYLLQLIKHTFISGHSTHTPHPVYRSHTRTKPDPLYLPYLCVYLTSDIPDSPPLQPFHVFPARKQRTVTASSAICILFRCALLTSRHLLVISPVSFKKYPIWPLTSVSPSLCRENCILTE